MNDEITKLEQKHHPPETARAVNHVLNRVRTLRNNATATHSRGMKDASTIKIQKRRALNAIHEAHDQTPSIQTEMLLEDLADEVKAINPAGTRKEIRTERDAGPQDAIA